MARGKPALGQEPWDTGPVDMTCMNPTVVCTSCIFYEGALARWCPPSERQAKAELHQISEGSVMRIVTLYLTLVAVAAATITIMTGVPVWEALLTASVSCLLKTGRHVHSSLGSAPPRPLPSLRGAAGIAKAAANRCADRPRDPQALANEAE